MGVECVNFSTGKKKKEFFRARLRHSLEGRCGLEEKLLNGTHFVLWDGQLGKGTTVGRRVVGSGRCGGAHGDAGGDGGHLPGVALCSDSWSLRSRVHVALCHGPHADEMLNQTLPELKGRQQQQQQTVMFVISPSRWITAGNKAATLGITPLPSPFSDLYHRIHRKSSDGHRTRFPGAASANPSSHWTKASPSHDFISAVLSRLLNGCRHFPAVRVLQRCFSCRNIRMQSVLKPPLKCLCCWSDAGAWLLQPSLSC